MNELIIKQKQSGTGSIHDLASEHYDRVIVMKPNTKYIVILPAYFGDLYSVHAMRMAAIRAYQSLKLGGYPPTILSRDGDEIDFTELDNLKSRR